jgi:hypothetical protein
MQHKATVPEAVLRATLADGTIVGSVVGDKVPMVRDFPGSTVKGFRSVWETRREIDFPSLAKTGRISRETERRWAARVTALLAFVDEHRATGLQDFLFVAAKVFVLYSPARERAFVVNLGTPGRAAKPADAVDRAAR